ncbi:MAG: GNAT family N-acetyltransferase [Spirochaetes bacterium]|nr:GNAT family N-acetyltransferase [Spirochaetota bacterium]
MQHVEVHFQHLDERHRGAIIDIYNYYIEHSFASFLETKADYHFYDTFISSMRGFPAAAIIVNSQTAGFCFLRSYSPIPAFRSAAEISYYLHPSLIGKGLGKQALEYLICEAKRINISHLIAQVSSLNTGGKRFHEKNGFFLKGTLEKIGEKFGQRFDVLLFQKTIAPI